MTKGDKGDQGVPGEDGVDGADGLDGVTPWTDNGTNLSTGVSIQIGDEDVTCDDTTAGTIRFTGTDFEACVGGIWLSLTKPLPRCYMDADEDGYGDINTYIPGCDITLNPGYVYDNTDCNDNDASIHPGADDIAGDGIDQDCDGVRSCFMDADGDGYGDINTYILECDITSNPGYVYDATDCDDNDASIHPGAADIPLDGIDQDCDGVDSLGFNIGDVGYAGGIVFYITEGGLHGLEAAPADQSWGAVWGCNWTEIAGADGTAVGTGAQNTADILAGCNEAGTAARIADAYGLGGYNDWFLPSKDELNELYRQQGVVDGFASGSVYYWSSTEVDVGKAWSQVVSSGSQFGDQKVEYNRVRAVRAF